MNKQNLRPQPAQPVHRITTGQLPPELAELSEETLSQLGAVDAPAAAIGVHASLFHATHCYCSYDGDDAE